MYFMYFVKQFRYLSVAALTTFVGSYSHVTLADDTDIYLGEEIQQNVTRPNILFVLDQSGSMAWETTEGNNPEAGEPSRMDELKAALRAVLSTVDNVNVGIMTFTRAGSWTSTTVNAPVVYPVTYVNAPANSVEPSIPVINASITALNDDASQSLNALNPEVSLDSLTLSFGSAVMGTLGQLERRLDWSEDDAEQRISNGSMRLDDSTLQFPTDGTYDQLLGLRFRDVNIPSNSTVTDARISFTADGDDNSTVNATIDVEKKLDPATFSWSSYDISSRILSGAPVNWLNVDSMNNGDGYTTPNLATLFNTQLLPADVGWDWDTSSKDVVFVLSGDQNRRRIESYDQNDNWNRRNRRAYLSVSYIEGSTTPEKMTVGLRFNDLNIPQGAQILSARLQVAASKSSSEMMDVSIYGENVDNAVAFEQVNNNISTRPKTTANATWKLEPNAADAWVQGEQYEYASAELVNVIQEIVDRGGWCGGNSLALIVEANINSDREIYSHEGNNTLSPKLSIDFENDVPLDNPRTGQVNTGCTRAFFSAQVMRSANDAEETSGGANYINNSVMRMGTNTIGLRFEGINLPQGSEIEQAKITLRAESDDTTGSSVHTINGQLSVNAAAFDQTQYGIRDRAKTSQSVNWSIPNTLSDNQYFDTADISPVVQEIVSQATWQKDSPMVLFISNSSKNRDIRAFDDAASNSARLTIYAKYFRAGVVGLPPVYTARDRILQTIDAIEPASSTPVVDAYYEAARYFRGEGIVYGDDRGGSQLTRVSHPASYVGGTPDPEGCTGVSSDDCRNEEIDGSPVYVSPITDPCAKNHIVLLTDGETNVLTSTSLIQSMTGVSSCANTPNNSYEACGRELSKFLSEEDQSSLPVQQKIITHTVAFALEEEGAVAFLQDLATQVNEELDADGNPKSPTAGLAVQASNAGTLIDAFQAILREVSDEPSSFAAPALSINAFNRFYNGNDIYLSLFTPSVRPVWHGNIKNFKLCSDSSQCNLGDIMYDTDGDPGTEGLSEAVDPSTGLIKSSAISNWNNIADGPTVTRGGAGAKIPDPDQRKVYTYTGADNKPTPFVSLDTDAHIVDNDKGPDSEAILGIPGEAERDKLIQWIRGVDVDDNIDDSDVHWRIADPLHSSPLAINYGTSGDTAITKLVVGTNEGGIRMINAYTGVEEWIFIPKELMDDQQDVRINSGNARFYGVDGVPSAWVYDKAVNGARDGIIDPTNGEFVYTYIGMRRGGNHYYALDITPNSGPITDPANTGSITPKFMWTISGNDPDFQRLGDSWSRPFPTRILMQEGGNTVSKNVLIFGGGYDEVLDNEFALNLTETKGNAIFIIDAKTGDRIWSASSSVADSDLLVSDMKYAIPSDVAVYDSDGDGYSDRIYVADMGGQLWRVDLASDMSKGNNGSTKVGKLAELSSTLSIADNRRFFYPPDIVEVVDNNFSNIARYDLVMIASGDRARPLNKSIQDRVYAIRDVHVDSIPDTGYGINASSDLYDVTNNMIQQGTEEQQTSEIQALQASKGWFFNLESPGEKGIARGIVLDSKFFITTFLPESSGSTNTCNLNSTGAGRLYAVNALYGGAAINWNDPDSPLNDPTKDDRYMELGAGIPSEAVPVFQEEGVTIIVGTGGSATSIDPNIKLPRYRTYWSETDESVSIP